MRLKQEHLNIAKFEPENGLDPMLDLVFVGSEWQFRIQSRASNWQDKLVVTSTRSVEQDAFSPLEVTSSRQSNFNFFLSGNDQSDRNQGRLPSVPLLFLFFFILFSFCLDVEPNTRKLSTAHQELYNY